LIVLFSLLLQTDGVPAILQTYKVYREERVRIRNSEIDCRMRMYDNLQYQSIVRFERIVSGRFSPLSAQLPLPLRSRSSGFRARSAPFSAPAPALLTCSAVISRERNFLEIP